MEGVESRPDLQTFYSASSTDAEGDATSLDSANGLSDGDGSTARHYSSASRTHDQLTPLSSAPSYGWPSAASQSSTRSLRMSVGPMTPASSTMSNSSFSKPSRPSNPPRQPSNAYAPQRRPHQYSVNTPGWSRDSSRPKRRDPNAEFRAQEKLYVEQIRQGQPDNPFYPEPRTPSLDYSSGSDSEGESASVNVDQDVVDVEAMMYYNEDIEPSVEQLKNPTNRERLEWHSMLANVLTGDVVKQEKKRLIGGGELQGENSLKAEVWTGVRAKVCGRSLAVQKRLLDDGRAKVKQEIESIMSFEINGEAETGKSPLEQVKEIVKRIEKIESLYPTRLAFEAAQTRAASAAYRDTCDAIIAWHNTTELINTELTILQKWVGNAELDFSAPRTRPDDEKENNLFDDTSFIDRILKDNSLKSLRSNSLRDPAPQKDNSLLDRVNMVILKAKATLISNTTAFAELHLPPYMEELLTLINFGSRLIQEIISVRLSYAKKMKGTAQQQGVMTAEQMIPQFRILLQLAVNIKETYTIIAQPEPGWDLPPCIDENFDSVIVDALKFYFKMLKTQLAAHKNTFKEAEILEQEWDFSNELGRYLEGGDIEVAEQFSYLTFHSMDRLAKNFQKELKTPVDDTSGTQEMDKRYKALLDSVRVRQRKIFRFSRILSQRFENATEYSINIDNEQFEDLLLALRLSGHFLVETPASAGRSSWNEKGPLSKIYIIASPSLRDRPRDIESMLGTCYHAEDALEDPSDPYVLLLRPEHPLVWEGDTLETSLGAIDAKMARKPHSIKMLSGRLRLIADGSLNRLRDANMAFANVLNGLDLHVLIEQRANLNQVDTELRNIRKSAHDLSHTIMDSVAIVRSQVAAVGRQLESQELIQTFFAFATEFGQRSAIYMDVQRRAMNQEKLTKLALDWISFICDDCVASDRKTFRWTVVALEFAMVMTRGQNILSISDEDYTRLRSKVAGCMSLLISHFDIMGARGSMAAQAANKITEAIFSKKGLDWGTLKDDDESSALVRLQRSDELDKIEGTLSDRLAERRALGRVMEDSNDADRALTHLSASAGNVHMRWTQGQFVGGGTFGSVYAAIDLDNGHMMAVKEIRLQDPKMIPTIVAQIRDEMSVLQVLDHPNIVQYYGIEPHRDKVYIFMEYCSGGSLASLLEQGRIEDEMVLQVFTLQLLEGLGYLHQANVVHRDIKPDNILLDHNSVIKYVDFGAAKVIARQGRTVVANPGPPGAAAQQGGGGMQGTPMYMAPETIKGTRQPGARLGAEDIWSLGCVINEMATGDRPWINLDNEYAIMYNIAEGKDTPPLPSADQMSAQGLDFLTRCFERNPAKRASAAELLQHEWMQSIMVQHSLVVPPTPQTPASENGFGALSASSSAAS